MHGGTSRGDTSQSHFRFPSIRIGLRHIVKVRSISLPSCVFNDSNFVARN
jgi:hypothetical protein